jgi:nucleoid-associated protein YgaU
LFLFFVVGLFMLQIAFAFTIHGDIGPVAPGVPGLERPATPFLIGKIDSLVTQPVLRQPVRPSPNAILAPAMKPTLDPRAVEPRTTGVAPRSQPSSGPLPSLQENGGRFLEYTVQRGDSLEGIARRFYGHSRMTAALIRLNRIADDRTLQCGDRLLLPRTGLKQKVNG